MLRNPESRDSCRAGARPIFTAVSSSRQWCAERISTGGSIRCEAVPHIEGDPAGQGRTARLRCDSRGAYSSSKAGWIEKAESGHDGRSPGIVDIPMKRPRRLCDVLVGCARRRRKGWADGERRTALQSNFGAAIFVGSGDGHTAPAQPAQCSCHFSGVWEHNDHYAHPTRQARDRSRWLEGCPGAGIPAEVIERIRRPRCGERQGQLAVYSELTERRPKAVAGVAAAVGHSLEQDGLEGSRRMGQERERLRSARRSASRCRSDVGRAQGLKKRLPRPGAPGPGQWW